MFALVFLAYPGACAIEGSGYRPDHLLPINAATALATVTPPAGAHAEGTPSFGFALLDPALYLVVFTALGGWRATRDA